MLTIACKMVTVKYNELKLDPKEAPPTIMSHKENKDDKKVLKKPEVSYNKIIQMGVIINK